MEGPIEARPPSTHIHPSADPRAFSVDLYYRRLAAGLHPEAHELALRCPTTAGGTSALRHMLMPLRRQAAGRRCVHTARLYVSSVVAKAWWPGIPQYILLGSAAFGQRFPPLVIAWHLPSTESASVSVTV